MSTGKKTLLNEVLPDPRGPAAGREEGDLTANRATPAERVAAYARTLLKRSSLIGPAVGLTMGCGYTVVDPMPEPSSCSDYDDPYPYVGYGASRDESSGDVVFELSTYYVDGFTVSDVQVTGGTLVSASEDVSNGDDSFYYVIIITPTPDTTEVTVRLKLACNAGEAVTHIYSVTGFDDADGWLTVEDTTNE